MIKIGKFKLGKKRKSNFEPYEPWKSLEKLKEENIEEEKSNSAIINTHEPKQPPETRAPWELWGYRIEFWDDNF